MRILRYIGSRMQIFGAFVGLVFDFSASLINLSVTFFFLLPFCKSRKTYFDICRKMVVKNSYIKELVDGTIEEEHQKDERRKGI